MGEEAMAVAGVANTQDFKNDARCSEFDTIVMIPSLALLIMLSENIIETASS